MTRVGKSRPLYARCRYVTLSPAPPAQPLARPAVSYSGPEAGGGKPGTPPRCGRGLAGGRTNSSRAPAEGGGACGEEAGAGARHLLRGGGGGGAGGEVRPPPPSGPGHGGEGREGERQGGGGGDGGAAVLLRVRGPAGPAEPPGGVLLRLPGAGRGLRQVTAAGQPPALTESPQGSDRWGPLRESPQRSDR